MDPEGPPDLWAQKVRTVLLVLSLQQVRIHLATLVGLGVQVHRVVPMVLKVLEVLEIREVQRVLRVHFHQATHLHHALQLVHVDQQGQMVRVDLIGL
jgi:hypothetical protein